MEQVNICVVDITDIKGAVLMNMQQYEGMKNIVSILMGTAKK